MTATITGTWSRSVERTERQPAEVQRMAHLGSWEWDLGEQALRWSEEHYRIFGHDPSTFVPTYGSFLACVDAGDRSRVDDEITAATTLGDSFQCTYRIVRPDGERRWVDLHGTPVRGSPGRRYVGTAHDVTERHLADQALKASEQRYRTIVETAREGVWVLDADARTTFVNDRLAALLGRTPEEIIGTSVFDHFDDEGARLAAERIQRRQSGIGEQQDVRFVDKSGSDVWTVMEMTPLHDAEGRYQGAVSMVTDITQRHRAEAALRESEARLAEAQRVARMGSWTLDVGSGRLVWSDELYRLLGHQARALPRRIAGLFARMHPDDAARMRCAMAVPALRREPWASEVRIELPDGSVRWLAARMELVEGRDGPVSIHGTAQDITDRRQAEERVRFQAHLLDAVGEAVVATDLAGVVTYWGPGAEHLYGWKAAEAVGRRGADLIRSESSTPAETARIVDRLRDGHSWTRVMERSRRDGSRFLAEVTHTPVLDDAGEIIAVIGISSDVTEREDAKFRLERLVAERTAHATEQSVVVDLGRIALSGAGVADVIATAVATVAATLGVEHAAVLEYRDDATTLVVDVASRDCEQAFGAAQHGANELRATITVRHRTHGALVVGTDDPGRAFTDHERNFLASVANVIGSVMERAELDQLKSDFVSTVSHELRTPVTSILGYLEILTSGEAGDVPDEQGHMLQVVERNGRRLLSLIEDLLTVSRLESERLSLVIAPVDVARLVDSAMVGVHAALAKRDLQVAVDLDAGLPPLAGDAEQLERALVNLLANAVKFTPDRGRVVVRAAAAGPRVRIEVADTGIGIPLEEQDHLFTRFFRASTARIGAVQGTGLGLSIVKSIVEGHQGEVTVQSAPGSGTTVRLALPVFPAA